MSATAALSPAVAASRPWSPLRDFWRHLRRSPLAVAGGALLVILYLMALLAPFLAPYAESDIDRERFFHPPTPLHLRDAQGHWHSPFVYGTRAGLDQSYEVDASQRYPLRLFPRGAHYRLFGLVPCDRHLFGVDRPGRIFLLGADDTGRDVWTRLLYGAQVSLTVGLAVAVLSTAIGILLGLAAGFVKPVEGAVMRVMDGLMAIPGILLAIAAMAVTRASLTTVVVAITIPEVPRVVRLVRALALTLREQLYVEAARAIGTRLPALLWRHVLPNMMAPLMVQATFVAASAVLIEAALSFLGVGVPGQTPSWGNMMAEGRNFVAVAFHIILYPGLLLACTVLAINLVGDGLRDALDPRLARQL